MTFIKIGLILIFIFNFLILPFPNSEGQNADEIFLLTNLPNGQHQIRIPFPFGLHFKWKEGYCKTEGLLICYPSKLAEKNAQGAKMTKRFKFGERENGTKIRKKCEEKMKMEGKSGEIWNGILLEEDGDLGRKFTMEIGLTGKRYYFDGIDEFTVELGPPTKLKVKGNWPKIKKMNAEEMRIYSNFVGQINSGAFFDEFLGLWAFGMDLLSSKGDSEIQIYINRSCDCSMKVWFLTNSTKEKMPKWGHIDKRPECAEAIKHNWIEMPIPLGKGQILNISLELAENTTQRAVIRLMHKWNEQTWERYAENIIDEQLGIFWANLVHPMEIWRKYNYGGLMNITIELGKQPEIIVENLNRTSIYNFTGIALDENGDGRFTFQILQNAHNLSVGLNGEWIVQGFWLHNWWDQIGVNMVKFEELIFLYAEPPAAALNDEQPIEFPKIYKIKELKGGETIILRAYMPKQIDKARGVQIKLLYNTNMEKIKEYEERTDEENYKYIIGEQILYIFINAKEPNNLYIQPPEKAGAFFELHILIPQRKFVEGSFMEEYSISTYYNHSIGPIGVEKTEFPLWKINRISIEGIQLIEMPRIVMPLDEMPKMTDYSIPIKELDYSNGKKGDLLLAGDRITIEGKVPEGAQEFNVNLCFHEDNCMIDRPTPFPAEGLFHPINDQSKIGSIVLYIRVMFNSNPNDPNSEYHPNQFNVNSWVRNDNENGEGGMWQQEIGKFAHNLVPGKQFKIEIELAKRNWAIRVRLNGNESQTAIMGTEIYRECDPAKNQNCRMPPWAADHLQIFGDIEVPIEGIVRDNTANKKELQLPYIARYENGLQINKNVYLLIKGKHAVKKEDEKILKFKIGFYHDGIGNFDWYRKRLKIGAAIIQMNFYANGEIKIFSFVNEIEKGGLNMKESVMLDNIGLGEVWLNKTELEVRIGMFEHRTTSKMYYIIKINDELKGGPAFELKLPLWAVDYLYIADEIGEGNFKLKEEPIYVFDFLKSRNNLFPSTQSNQASVKMMLNYWNIHTYKPYPRKNRTDEYYSVYSIMYGYKPTDFYRYNAIPYPQYPPENHRFLHYEQRYWPLYYHW